MVQIKVCGLTNIPDALCAVDAGADFLGFVFYSKSPRNVSWHTAGTIVSAVKAQRPDVVCVGLFVDEPEPLILSVLDFCGLDLAQLHGNEPPYVVSRFGWRAYKAIRPRSLAELHDYLSRYEARFVPPDLLFDAYVPGKPGGTGQVGDWSLATQLAARRRIFLAGGLTPHNVSEAILVVRPWGVDVSSGVEEAPGRKSHAAIRQFVSAVRESESRLASGGFTKNSELEDLSNGRTS